MWVLPNLTAGATGLAVLAVVVGGLFLVALMQALRDAASGQNAGLVVRELVAYMRMACLSWSSQRALNPHLQRGAPSGDVWRWRSPDLNYGRP